MSNYSTWKQPIIFSCSFNLLADLFDIKYTIRSMHVQQDIVSSEVSSIVLVYIKFSIVQHLHVHACMHMHVCMYGSWKVD